MKFMRYADIEEMRDSAYRSKAEEREINAYLADRVKKAEQWKRGKVESLNNQYRAGVADLANAKRLALELAARIAAGKTSAADGQDRLEKLRQVYEVAKESVESAASNVAEVADVEPIALYESDIMRRIPALATRMKPPPASLFRQQP